MRKILALIAVITAGVLILTACSKNKNTALSLTVEPPVTIEQVNSDSNSVARAYLESLLFGNKEMFSKCYPEGFLEALPFDDTGNLLDCAVPVERHAIEDKTIYSHVTLLLLNHVKKHASFSAKKAAMCYIKTTIL